MTLAEADPQSWPCAVCDKPSRPRVHPGCEDRMRANLEALPALYRQLADVLQPGRRGGPAVSGSRTAPIPCALDVLDLRNRGGIEGVVGGWARDLCERENWTVPDYGNVRAIVDWACKILTVNLPMICDEHPAVRELASELRSIVGQCERLVTGEQAPRQIRVQCECGSVLRITVDTDGRRCPGCDVQYGHAELFSLPLAQRAAA